MLKVFFLIFVLDGNDFWIKTSSHESCQEMYTSFQSQDIWSACVEGEVDVTDRPVEQKYIFSLRYKF